MSPNSVHLCSRRQRVRVPGRHGAQGGQDQPPGGPFWALFLAPISRAPAVGGPGTAEVDKIDRQVAAGAVLGLSSYCSIQTGVKPASQLEAGRQLLRWFKGCRGAHEQVIQLPNLGMVPCPRLGVGSGCASSATINQTAFQPRPFSSCLLPNRRWPPAWSPPLAPSRTTILPARWVFLCGCDIAFRWNCAGAADAGRLLRRGVQ